jgi:hypothetical protein
MPILGRLDVFGLDQKVLQSERHGVLYLVFAKQKLRASVCDEAV